MPNLILLGSLALVLFGLAAGLADVSAGMTSGVWRPETLGDWLKSAQIEGLQDHLPQDTAAVLDNIPLSLAALCAAALIYLLAPASRG